MASIEEPSSTSPRVVRIDSLIDSILSDYAAAEEARISGRPRGPITGFRLLDDTLGGFLQPGPHILQAAPGCGKSAFALQVGAQCPYPVLFTTFEMPVKELFLRHVARETDTFLSHLKLSHSDLSTKTITNKLTETAQRLHHFEFLDGTNALVTSNDIITAANDLRDTLEQEHILVIIDSLHAWSRGASVASSLHDLINGTLSAADAVAKSLACPVLLISQRSREGQKKATDKLHASKGSGDIEYIAETVIDLGRERGSQTAQLTIEKNRNGEEGKCIEFTFNGAVQRFTENGDPDAASACARIEQFNMLQ